MRLRPLAVLMSVAVLSLGVGAAHATVLADLRFQTLRAASDLVVIAQVGGREVVATPPGTLTAHEVHTEFAVERALVGRAPSTLVLRQLGDGACGAGEHIEDDACLRPGSRVLLFLPTREGPFVHLALLGFSAFDLLQSATGTLAVPQARLPHAPAPDEPPRIGEVTTLEEIERALGIRPRERQESEGAARWTRALSRRVFDDFPSDYVPIGTRCAFDVEPEPMLR